MVEGAPVMRHGLLWGLWHLFDRGPAAEHVAATALQNVLQSHHASEVFILVQLKTHSARYFQPRSWRLTPALPAEIVSRERVAFTRNAAMFAFKNRRIEAFRRVLARNYCHASPRAQIIALMVTDTALKDALYPAHTEGVEEGGVRYGVHPIDRFCRELAAAANSHEDYVDLVSLRSDAATRSVIG